MQRNTTPKPLNPIGPPGLVPWLAYNARLTDHRAPLRAYVPGRNGLVRVRTVLDRA